MSSAKPNAAVQSVVNELLADLHAKGGCEKIGLTRESFCVILSEIGSKHLQLRHPNPKSAHSS